MLKNFINEFKKFAMRGNVIDMAVGIIIGAAFGKIVDSLVKDVIMPPIGLILGKVDFANLFLVLKDGPKTPAPYESLDAASKAGAVTLNIGVFINVMISFIIVAFAVFILIKAVNKLQASLETKEAAAAPTTRTCPYCFSDISVKATKCPHCTSEVTPVPQQPSPVPAPDTKDFLPLDLTKAMGEVVGKTVSKTVDRINFIKRKK